MVIIILGFILVGKGIVFIGDITRLQSLIGQTGVGAFNSSANLLSFIIGYLTLLCGMFIGCGLFTLSSSLVQIPVMLVSIIFVKVRMPEPGYFELVLSIITLVLLVIFSIKGSGQLSADEFFRSYYKADMETGHTGRLFQNEEGE